VKSKTPDEIIAGLGLIPHPEGGHYREIIRSPRRLEIPDSGTRNAVTSIYFLLQKGEVSRWHRVASDEIWIWLEGDAMELHASDLLAYAIHELSHENRQVLVPAHHWQAAKTKGQYSLMACIVAPGFDFQDFELIEPASTPARKLLELHPSTNLFM